MARIAGINIPPHKHSEIGLTSIYGIGRTTAQKICNSVGIAYSKKIKDLSDTDLERIRDEIGKMTIEGDQVTMDWTGCDPRECAAALDGAAAQGPVALLFGRESSGLTNEELDRCDRLVQIPANPDYSSLNVAMAVQVLAYELLLASRGEAAMTEAERVPATAAQMESFFTHLAQALDDIGFTTGRRSEKLLRRLRRLFLRVRPDEDELTILRGILSAAQGRKSMRRD
jgi:TrmH family RNA methyltransferase